MKSTTPLWALAGSHMLLTQLCSLFTVVDWGKLFQNVTYILSSETIKNFRPFSLNCTWFSLIYFLVKIVDSRLLDVRTHCLY